MTEGWVGVAHAAIAAVSTLVLAYLAYLQFKLKTAVTMAAAEAKQSTESAAVKVEEVRQTAQAESTKLDGLVKTTHQVHDLVNSGSLVQLRLYAVAARRIADLTGEAADEKTAAEAEALFNEHTAKQQAVTTGDQRSSTLITSGGCP